MKFFFSFREDQSPTFLDTAQDPYRHECRCYFDQGGMPGAAALRDCKILESVVNKQAADGCFYAAGKKATIFPPMCDKLSDQGEIDSNLITSRGPGTSMEFALAIVEKFFGHEKALELAKTMLVVNA